MASIHWRARRARLATSSKEVQHGEAMGLGSAFISERFNIKEAATLSGAVGAVSSEIGIATAATNHNTRHPMVTGTGRRAIARLAA